MMVRSGWLWTFVSSCTLLLLLLAVPGVESVPSTSAEVVLSSRTCFGASGSSWGHFTIPGSNALPVTAFKLQKVGTEAGVTCAIASHSATPFQCKEFFSVGIVCGNTQSSTGIIRGDLNQVLGLNQTAASTSTVDTTMWLTDVNHVIPGGAACAVVYLGDFYNSASATTSSGTSCVSISAFVISQPDASLAAPSAVASIVTVGSSNTTVPQGASCFSAGSETLCTSRAFCSWSPHSQTCCPLRSALNSTTEDPRCTCPIVDPLLRLSTATINPTCNIGGSSLFLRNLAARYCQDTSIVSFPAATCLAEFKRCALPPTADTGTLRPNMLTLNSLTLSSAVSQTPPVTYSALVDLALSFKCQKTNFATCVDPSATCSVVTPQPTPAPTQFNATGSPNGVALGVASVFGSKTEISLASVQDGTAVIIFSLVQGGNVWNQTAFYEGDMLGGTGHNNLLRRAFVPVDPNVKFGWFPEVVIPNRSYFISSESVAVPLGPTKLRPETLNLPMKFIPPPGLFEEAVSGSTTVHFTIQREPQKIGFTRFTNVISVATAYGTLMSGASGWLGLVSLQTNMMMSHMDCSELDTQLMFPNARYIVTPWRYVKDDYRFVYLIGLGTLIFTVGLHLSAMGIYVLWQRPRVLIEATRATWSPYLVLWFAVVSLVGMTQTAWTGLIDDKTAYVRVLFGLTDVAYVTVLLIGWDWARRRGFEGYYQIYGDDDNSSSPTTVRSNNKKRNARSPTKTGAERGGATVGTGARSTNVFKARWEELKLAHATGTMKLFFTSGLLHWFMPKGHWPKARGFTAIREQCHETGCAFTWIALLFYALAGVNASHVSADRIFCYTIYWNYTVLSVVFLVLFLFFTPFRTPILNVLWIIRHLLEIALYARQARWTWVYDPAENDGSDIPWLALLVLLSQAAFNSYVLVVTMIERLISFREAFPAFIGLEEGGGEQDEDGEDMSRGVELGHLEAGGGVQHSPTRNIFPASAGGSATYYHNRRDLPEEDMMYGPDGRSRRLDGHTNPPSRFSTRNERGRHFAATATSGGMGLQQQFGLGYQDTNLAPVLVVIEPTGSARGKHFPTPGEFGGLGLGRTGRYDQQSPIMSQSPDPYQQGSPTRAGVLSGSSPIDERYSPRYLSPRLNPLREEDQWGRPVNVVDQSTAGKKRKALLAGGEVGGGGGSLSPPTLPISTSQRDRASPPLTTSGGPGGGSILQTLSNAYNPSPSPARNQIPLYIGPTTVELGPVDLSTSLHVGTRGGGGDLDLTSDEIHGSHILSIVSLYGATRVRAPKKMSVLHQQSKLSHVPFALSSSGNGGGEPSTTTESRINRDRNLQHIHQDLLDADDRVRVEEQKKMKIKKEKQQREKEAEGKGGRSRDESPDHDVDDFEDVGGLYVLIDFATFHGALEAVGAMNNRIFYGKHVSCQVTGPIQAVKQARHKLL